MIILAVETSCDDTGIALLKRSEKKRISFKILSNVISSQIKIHQKWGGVYPSLAKREHQRNLPIVLKKAMKEAGFAISNFQFPISKQILKTKLKIPNIDAIAVTVGPGLEPCLWVGVNFAKDLAKKLNLPIIPINHIEAHILANFIGGNHKLQITNYKDLFPAVCLVVSGGHTQLILMKEIGKYKILGETKDDAAGECFDKTARILGLAYPGGPFIATEAAKFKIQNSRFKIQLPRPMIYQKNYDFSFSGLKTAVLYKIKSETFVPSSDRGKLKTKNKKREAKSEKFIQAMCAEIQQAIIDVLISKTLRATKDYKAKTIILGGGVIANDELRKQFKSNIKYQMPNVKFLIPPKNLCTDNATMIGVAAFFLWQKKKTKSWRKIEANANLRIS